MAADPIPTIAPNAASPADPSPPTLPPIAPPPLRIPIFRAVWVANLISNFGTIIQSVGASWMMIALSASAVHVALVQASTTLPIMLLALVAGAMADSMDRRLVMLAAQALMLVASTALALFAVYGHLTPWLLLAFTFLIGCGTAFNGPAWQASVGDMVPRPALPGAIALNSVGFNIARSVGPGIGGAIVAAAGAGAAFLANAVSYLPLIVVLLRWKPEREARRLPRESLGTAIGAGLRYVALSPDLRLTLGRAMLFGVAASSSSALMPLVARDLMAGGPLTFGLLLGSFGIGSVIGALRSGWLRARLTTEGIVRGSTLTLALGSVAVAISPALPLTMLALAFYGAGWVLALSSFNASVQLGSPRWVVARAISLYQMFAFGGMAIGSYGFGMLAEAHGVAGAMLAAAGLHGVGLAASWLWPLPQTGGRNLDPLGRWTEPETLVAVEGRSGPVVISIEYRIAPANAVAFLNVMDERRRIRMRDGARNWRLLRDLADDRLWVERYQVPTWLDYVRHNERRTQADAATGSSIRALHEGEWPPTIHRMIERRTASVPSSDERATTDLSPPLTDPTRYS
ncbi:MFS transporter [Sphingobium sufflavum]|uniref:MFS transporter n=1 Tax=Sphingobium sufflavum TaxID=1129547 RepID=UPI001F1A3CE0|nr:MFS transporter [Sphingobium sufflavum]MCE7795103.1 MFS transporter [Sphingobium sufflavum]